MERYLKQTLASAIFPVCFFISRHVIQKGAPEIRPMKIRHRDTVHTNGSFLFPNLGYRENETRATSRRGLFKRIDRVAIQTLVI